ETASLWVQGACCHRKRIEALKMAASGSDKDNNPKESSERVRAAAEVSLNACETTADLPPEPPEQAPGAKKIEPPLEEARIRPRIRAIPMADNAIQPAGF